MLTTNRRRSYAIPQSFNHYAYVQNDPVNFIDPSGLDPDVIRFYTRAPFWSNDPTGGAMLAAVTGGDWRRRNPINDVGPPDPIGGGGEPQHPYEPRVDFRDYAESLSKTKS